MRCDHGSSRLESWGDRIVPGVAFGFDRSRFLCLLGLLVKQVTVTEVRVELLWCARNHRSTSCMDVSAGRILEQDHRELFGRHNVGVASLVDRIGRCVDLELTALFQGC